MLPRTIVRDPSVARGRWRFEHTTVFIDDIRRAYADNPDSTRRVYESMGVSADEFAAAMAFDFPIVTEADISVIVMEVTVTCPCGIARRTHIDETTLTDPCLCGRVGRVSATMVLEPPGSNRQGAK